MKKTDSILVTGGNGFIPSHLVDRLVELGHNNVNVIDDLSGAVEPFIPLNNKVKYFRGDISRRQFVQAVFEEIKPSYIFHLAANANVPYGNKYPGNDFDSNCRGSFNILNLASTSEVKKVVYASTAAVYGEPAYAPMDEKHALKPTSYYGASKLYGETLGMALSKSFGLNFTALRIFNTYGPRQPRYVLYDLLKKLEKDKTKIQILGDGKQIRDYCYVKDTVSCFLLAAKSKNSNGKSFNVAGGNPVSISQLAHKLFENLGISPEVEYTNQSWKGDISNLSADISKARNELGFSPKVGFDEGLSKTVAWFIKNEIVKL